MMKKSKGRKGLTLESALIAIIIVIVVVIALNLLSFAFGKGYESGEGLFGFVNSFFGLKPVNGKC